jgi:hypothetical protein
LRLGPELLDPLPDLLLLPLGDQLSLDLLPDLLQGALAGRPVLS